MIFEHDFPRASGSVPRARHFAEKSLVGLPEAFVGLVALMVSELATNALRHGATPFDVRIDAADDGVAVEVSDNGTGGAVRRSPVSSDPTGRGLQVVDALADEWGVRPAAIPGWRNTVWFSLALPGAARSG
ncbi:MAG TPA: ATP-binding protein [Acidimicrobiales bacterium]|nr:ATP-binding protein [Acidimicrobiales bacterium]